MDVVGVAWGGRGGVSRVEVSVDGGKTFGEASFDDPDRPGCWRRWRWSWRPEAVGPRLLVARATDGTGATQPFASDEELGNRFSVSGPDRINTPTTPFPSFPFKWSEPLQPLEHDGGGALQDGGGLVEQPQVGGGLVEQEGGGVHEGGGVQEGGVHDGRGTETGPPEHEGDT